jgi:hypothetical protein
VSMGNSAVNPSPGSHPIINGSHLMDNSPQASLRRAAARRLTGKNKAIEASKMNTTPDDKTSFEGI